MTTRYQAVSLGTKEIRSISYEKQSPVRLPVTVTCD
jgi:hypothetical protein